ncbi:MAG: gamma-glutamylcyclotransferase [Leptolyngbya sp. SIOISBB]|nr:gamma-glutamylcyclotransferase [Leptolyngbya sp. SIOISBB]
MYPVFVYGTLKPQEAAYEKYCDPFVVSAQPAIMRGELFHLPQGYPAMTVGDRWIRGALLTFRDAAAIARIDHFEDYDPMRPPHANLYQRLRQPVFAITQQPLGTAWVYLMSPQQVCVLGGTRVDNGRWSKQLFPSI